MVAKVGNLHSVSQDIFDAGNELFNGWLDDRIGIKIMSSVRQGSTASIYARTEQGATLTVSVAFVSVHSLREHVILAKTLALRARLQSNCRRNTFL